MEVVRAELALVEDNNVMTTTVYPYFINTSAQYVGHWKLRYEWTVYLSCNLQFYAVSPLKLKNLKRLLRRVAKFVYRIDCWAFQLYVFLSRRYVCIVKRSSHKVSTGTAGCASVGSIQVFVAPLRPKLSWASSPLPFRSFRLSVQKYK